LTLLLLLLPPPPPPPPPLLLLLLPVPLLLLMLLPLLQVTDALGKLVFTLVSMLFIAAGMFYELEKFAVSDQQAGCEVCSDSQQQGSVNLLCIGQLEYGALQAQCPRITHGYFVLSEAADTANT
jgi:hypothetical protein